jgi:hypothetical protein
MKPIALVLADAGTSPTSTGSHSQFTNFLVLVENLAFVKQVQILGRDTISGSWNFHPLTFSSSVPGNGEIWTTQLGGATIDQFVVQYVVLGETFWDNNSGFNYLLDTVAAGKRDGTNTVALAPNVLSFGRGGVDAGNLKIDVLVRNLAFFKRVGIVFTADNWATVHSALGTFKETFPPLNAPNQPNAESWHVSVPVGAATGQFAIFCDVNGSTFWDNNFGANYSF